MKKALAGVAAAIIFLSGGGAALAQVNTDDLKAQIAALLAQVAELQRKLNEAGGGITPVWCHNFNVDIQFGQSGEEVKALRIALDKSGLTTKEDGSFGEETSASVVAFQQKYGIRPTGYVGPVTRARLNSLYGCGQPTPVPPIIIQPPSNAGLTLTHPNGGGYFYPGSTMEISWNAIGMPRDAVMGAMLVNEATGANEYGIMSGYCGSAWGKYTCVSASAGRYIWNIPTDVKPGAYRVRLFCATRDSERYCSPDGTNATGRYQDVSDSYFKIDSGSVSAPYISGVSGPTTLQAGQTGTWTINATDKSGGYLNYSVTWGDEYIGATGNSLIAILPKAQQTATFTHLYSTPGTFYPTFTVANASGQSAKTSISVNIAGVSIQKPQVLYPNGGETLYQGKTPALTWLSPGGNQNVDLYMVSADYARSYILAANVSWQAADKQIFYWDVGTSLSGPVPGGKYFFRVCPHNVEKEQNIRCDYSDSPFYIEGSGGSTILNVIINYPNGGETLIQGQQHTFSWQGGKNKVQVGLVPSSATANSPPTILGWITMSGSPNGSLSWDGKSLCDAAMGSCQPLAAGSYKVIAVTEDQNGNYLLWDYLKNAPGSWDLSDNYFTITGGSLSLKFPMATITGVKDTYIPGETITITAKAVEHDGSPTSWQKGFNLQVYAYNAARTNYSSWANGVYNESTGTWTATLTMPTDTSAKYSLRTNLYCSRTYSDCGKYGSAGGEGDNRYYDFTLAVFTPVASCSYYVPMGCTLVPGPNYTPVGNCGLVVSCPATSTTSAASAGELRTQNYIATVLDAMSEALLGLLGIGR